MKNKIRLLTLSVLILATLACNTLIAPTPTPTRQLLPMPTRAATFPYIEADVPRILVKEAKIAFDEGQAVIVDVRGAEFFAEEHIAGALSIPLVEFENNLANIELDKKQWIITYCT